MHPSVQAIEVVEAPSQLWHCFWFQVFALLSVPDKQVQPSLMATTLSTVLLYAGVPAHVPPLQPSLVRVPVQVCPAACVSAAKTRVPRSIMIWGEAPKMQICNSCVPAEWKHEWKITHKLGPTSLAARRNRSERRLGCLAPSLRAVESAQRVQLYPVRRVDGEARGCAAGAARGARGGAPPTSVRDRRVVAGRPAEHRLDHRRLVGGPLRPPQRQHRLAATVVSHGGHR